MKLYKSILGIVVFILASIFVLNQTPYTQTDWDEGLTPSDTLLIKYNWEDTHVDINAFVYDLDSSQVYKSKPFDISMWNAQSKLYFSAATDTGAGDYTEDTLIIKVYEYVDEDYNGLLLKTFTFYGSDASPWHVGTWNINPMDSLLTDAGADYGYDGGEYITEYIYLTFEGKGTADDMKYNRRAKVWIRCPLLNTDVDYWVLRSRLDLKYEKATYQPNY